MPTHIETEKPTATIYSLVNSRTQMSSCELVPTHAANMNQSSRCIFRTRNVRVRKRNRTKTVHTTSVTIVTASVAGALLSTIAGLVLYCVARQYSQRGLVGRALDSTSSLRRRKDIRGQGLHGGGQFKGSGDGEVFELHTSNDRQWTRLQRPGSAGVLGALGPFWPPSTPAT